MATISNKSHRGPNFTTAEDLLVAKAFIAASEDSVKGANQTAEDFKKRMHDKYKLLLSQGVIASSL
jgi:hypothetical protein